ncbi:hypothetical protein [Paraliomyxa miuraensis]|uniref:hypothetical protein n=1 Tax=Paraliomyxa miuraensis TaxID=376150 RepID=UPI00225BB259|nr:hypothetical protein [Paraliomyxa miuraensis]MCX4239441.1 hypothetical protein [Paraliomyxa miuraensis]
MALDSDTSSGVPEDMTAVSSGSGDESIGEPFDASRWIGRYHFENTFLPFGERGDPGGDYSLVNFEILPDSRASLLYDDCNFELPIVIAYEWLPSDDGWLNLHPGQGETSLRFLGRTDVETLRVQLIEPCRELEFEADGRGLSFSVVRPGESCWVDRCTTPHTMQVDYCGE